MRNDYDSGEELFESYPELDEYELLGDLAPEIWESEWEARPNGQSKGYVRWVQQTLNKVLGLRLMVDGIMSPATRSAIRSFQQKQGLAVDGIVGPKTEAALRNAFGAATRGLSNSTQLETVAIAEARTLTYDEVIDARISVPAQHSLVRLSKNSNTSAAAVAMLKEIKAGRLGGISCVNWKKAALRAQSLGKTWWTVIPKGEDAALMLDPDNLSGGQPLIAFRRELDPRPKGCGRLPNEKPFPPSPARLDAALLKAWSTYRAYSRPVPPHRCGAPQRENRAMDLEFEVASCLQTDCKRKGTKCIPLDQSIPKVCLFASHEPTHDCQGLALFFGMADRWVCLTGAIGPIPFTTGHELIAQLFEVQARIAPQRIKEVHIFAHMFEEGIIGGTDCFNGLYRDAIVEYRSRSRKCKQIGQCGKRSLCMTARVSLFEPTVCEVNGETQEIIPRGLGATTIQDIPAEVLADDVIFVLHGCNTANTDPCFVINDKKENFAFALWKHLVKTLKDAKVFGHYTSVCSGQNRNWMEFSRAFPTGKLRTGKKMCALGIYNDTDNRCCQPHDGCGGKN